MKASMVDSGRRVLLILTLGALAVWPVRVAVQEPLRAPTGQGTVVRIDAAEARRVATEVRESSSIQLADGLEIGVWATGHLVADALALDVAATEIGLVRRDSGVNLDRHGETQQDAGASISANSIDFDTTTPTLIGRGRLFRFGVPNPFDAAKFTTSKGPAKRGRPVTQTAGGNGAS